MKKLIHITGCLLLLIPMAAFSQYALHQKASSLEIQGTSTLHDWVIVAEKMEGSATLTTGSDALNVSALSFSVVVEELKSGKGGMDKNTYKALNEDKYPKVTYSLKSVDGKKSLGNGKYELATTGTLTISGKSKSVEMKVVATMAHNAVAFNGEYKMKMTDFSIDPPVAMFGTIKTGDDVVIIFNVKYNQ